MGQQMKRATVVFLINNDGSICLARKKQAIHHEGGAIKYSLGMYNGYGGKMEESDETIYHTAIRELHDESSISASIDDLKLVSRVYFYVKKEGNLVPFMDVSFFFLTIWNGEPCETDEMGLPQFFAPHDIPYHEMMPADKPLMVSMISGERKVFQVMLFGKDLPPEIKELDEKLV